MGLEDCTEEELKVILKYILNKLNLEVIPAKKPSSSPYSSKKECSQEDESEDDDDNPPPTKIIKTAPTNQKTQRVTNNIITNNRYDVLNEMDIDNTQETNEPVKVNNNKLNSKTIINADSLVKKAKIPPIILRDKTKWIEVSSKLRQHNINYCKAKTVAKGIQIYPNTEKDYSNLYKFLKHENFYFHTYELESEKLLKIVIRGVPQELTEENVQIDLEDQGYPVAKVVRMNGKNNRPAPLILIEIDRQYKSIYSLAKCCGLDVIVESLRPKAETIQCRRCQMFGHAQKNCNAEYRCLKCADNHSTHLCTKSRTTPAKCANCAGEHVSSSPSCPENPNNPLNIKQKEVNKTNTSINPWKKQEKMTIVENKNEKQIEVSKTTPNTSTQQVSAPKTQLKSIKNTSDDIALAIGKLFLSFSELKPNENQQRNFLNETNKLIALFNKK